MSEKTVLVTGASRGIGAATARAVIAVGANVALMARSATDLQDLADELGERALPTPGDVKDPEDCQQVIGRVTAHFGGLDALVNNAGVLEPIAPIDGGLVMDWENNLKINLFGPILMSRLALPFLRQVHGVIVQISSGAAVKVVPGWAAYCTSKAGLNHFNRCLAAEEPEITTLAFRPGVVDTAMQTLIRAKGADGMPENEHARFVRYKEKGQLRDPEYVGRVIAALALQAPPEWSGEFLDIGEERVQKLVEANEESA